MQNNMNLLKNWLNNWRIQESVDKTKAKTETCQRALCTIRRKTHGAKFAIKVFQQSENDRMLRLFENSKTTNTRKLLADSRTFGSLSSYSQDSMKKIVYRRWNNRLRNLNLSDNFGFQAKREGILPKHLTKAHTKRMVQLLTQHSVLCNFQFHIGRCFTPVCTCMLEEESTEHFLYRCPFYSIRYRQMFHRGVHMYA